MLAIILLIFIYYTANHVISFIILIDLKDEYFYKYNSLLNFTSLLGIAPIAWIYIFIIKHYGKY